MKTVTFTISLIFVIVGIAFIIFSAFNPQRPAARPINWFNLGWGFVLIGVLVPLT